ncbi:MAG: hypothetical protein ACFFFT_18210 [Candidatus Thorarchaeota archaeon]
MRKMKLKMATTLIALSFIIIAMSTSVATAYPNRTYFIAIGPDLDLPKTTNFMIGTIKSGRGSEPPTAQALFYSKIHDHLNEKKYVMTGMLKGERLTKEHYFYCPVFNVWFINVWLFMGDGIFKTTDTNIEVFFRNLFLITMPNTEGEYISAPMLMLLSPTAEYYEVDPEDPLNPETIPWDEPPKTLKKGWVLPAVLWDVGIPKDFGFGVGILPIGPLSYLTISIGM